MTTPRLSLRVLTDDDAGFVLELLNDPDFLTFIGDRGVHDLVQARAYAARMRLSVEASGFGMQCIERRADGARLGVCGLLERDWLPFPDVGYALLPAFRGAGYAREATQAMVDVARARGQRALLAIVSPGNRRSRHLLEALQFRHDGEVVFPAETAPVCRYRLDFP